MKKQSFPLIPVISGALALIAVAAVIIIVVSAGGDTGLYITEASGSVSISNVDKDQSDSTAGNTLRQGDILTVGEGASCRLMYKSKKNSEDNFILVSSGSQLVITDDFNGKKNGELYLNRGSLLCNLAGSDSAKIYVRTADSMVSPEGTVTAISYFADGFESYTNVYTFMGNSQIQLYDAQGKPVNEPEYLVQKRTGRVTTNDLGPVFSYLNIEFPLSDISAIDLKNLVAISTLVEGFPYSSEELKAAYDSAPDKGSVPADTEAQSPDASEPIFTAAPIETTVPEDTEPIHEATTGPAITTKPVPTVIITQAPDQTSATTAAPPAQPDDPIQSGNGRTLTVVVIIDGDETIQEVPYGGNAERPADPYVEGKRFIGWDRSFENITEDTVITAQFETDGSGYVPPVQTDPIFTTASDAPANDTYHIVTVKIADKTTTLTVKDGESAPLPSEISIEGYIFKGWDTDFSNVCSDITVTAILEPIGSFTVTFMIDGSPHYAAVDYGGTAVPPFTPFADSNGNLFTGWDKPLTNITSNTVITALFAPSEHTVTFVIEGSMYPVKVKHGEAAVPPLTPVWDSTGTKIFSSWDRDFSNVTSDMTVTAIFVG